MKKDIIHEDNSCKKGFTLAEVLITLGIIGVVAAMTLPVLIQKYNKIVWYTQFRKAASQLEQALKLYQIDRGCEGDISECVNIGHGNFELPMDIPNFAKDLMSYFDGAQEITADNYNQICAGYNKRPAKGGYYENCCYPQWSFEPHAWISKDGALYALGLDEGVGNGYVLDVNGPNKGPNEFGRDIFVFYMRYEKEDPDGIVWGGFPKYNEHCDPHNVEDRYGCAAKLLSEGKMNY